QSAPIILHRSAEYHRLPLRLSRITKRATTHYQFGQKLAGLSIEQTGLVSRRIKIGVFLIDLLVAVDPVLLRIVPHGVIPPIEQWLGFGLVDGIAIAAARVVLNQSGRHIINLAVSMKGIEHDEETGLVVVQFIDPCVEIRLCGKGLCTPPGQRIEA
ncbi:MAG: hypothetical protein OEY77_07340, partial [Nitrospira sp.]|nr:hypothetical protein [Nitrospira sp.]